MRRLPPLNALRAFETAARHGTLVRAAQELLVTPTAVSRHVKHLEELVGTRLFERDGGTLTLTREGRQYARTLSHAFEMMVDATALLLGHATRTPITVRAYTTFLVRWLIPELPDFQRLHPDIDVRLETAFDAVDFDRDQVELGVLYGDGRWPDLHATLLFRDELVAVCGNALRQRFANAPLTEALAAVTLLSHSLRLDDWPDWLREAGVERAATMNRLPFNDMALILQSAKDGLGVALTQRCYIPQDLADGHLHLIAPTVLRRERGFYLVCRREALSVPGVQAFIEWVDRMRLTKNSTLA